MAITPNYASAPTVGVALLQAGDTSRLAPINFGIIFAPSNAGANNGGQVERLIIEPIGTTLPTVLRLFRYDGTTMHLFYENTVAALTAANSTAITPTMMEAVDNPNLFPILVPAGWTLRASINDTQIMQEAALSSVALAQTTAAAGQLSLNGSGVTAAGLSTAATAQTATINVPFTLTSAASAYVLPSPSPIALTSASNVSTLGYRLIGRTLSGAMASETIIGPNIGTVYSTNIYKALLAVIPNNTNAGTLSVGSPALVGPTTLPLPCQIMLTSGGNLSAVNFTITGMNTAGALLTETMAGPVLASVLSANTYAAVFTIAASAAVSANVQVGTPAILSGIKVAAEGGSY